MIEDLATLLMNKTCMERLNKAEVESVLNFLMAGGYLVDPNAPEVVTVPREEMEEIKPEFPKWTDASERPWQMVVDDLKPEPIDWTKPVAE